ncbi:hypothetical protein KUCAC02_035331 [Chaenocephalus aceratus]|nr:hypothetical protein KUCAC02_035331 [Chaenocephalus aceratus]
MDLLEKLFESQVISESEMMSARSKSRNDGAREGAREVVDTVGNKGVNASTVLIKALRELDPLLYEELNKQNLEYVTAPASSACG